MIPETAKDILKKHGLHELPEDEVRDILAAMEEYAKMHADKAFDAGERHERHKSPGFPEIQDKSTYMKQLFPDKI